MIQQLHISNFKCFKDIQIAFGQITLFSGTNSSGKSSAIQALLLLDQVNKNPNVLDLHLHSESFYLHFLNKLYNWTLTDENANIQNVEAFDLIDHTQKYIIQVSATATKEKIESSLSKASMANFKEYAFKFVSIAKDADGLRKSTFKNPHGIQFTPSKDIIDKKSILISIKGFEIDKQKEIYEFIKKELGTEVDPMKLETNLASIIKILSEEHWNCSDTSDISSFEIERKIQHNDLIVAKAIIDDYVVHYARIAKIYTEFDLLGSNKSISVLATVRKKYVEAKIKTKASGDMLFLEVITKVQDKVLNSANSPSIPLDELELCVNILVVDAFIRCKIFENPKDYNYVATR